MNSKVFEEALLIIREKGGKCLTKSAKTQYDKIEIECEKGHKWEAVSKNIKNGRWCPECFNNNRSVIKLDAENKLIKIKSYFQTKNAKCLSNVYNGRFAPLDFECELGHKWTTTWACIVNGGWCHVCSKIQIIERNKNGTMTRPAPKYKYTIEDVKRISKEKGGECLSDVYFGSKKMKFRCQFNHEWEATGSNIISRNSWCPICSASLYERTCRLFFEEIFAKSFPTSYPKWLINNEGNSLELDGYCEELSLAFEHNGKHHYNVVNYIGSKPSDLTKTKNHDQIKYDLCNKNNVKLIVIPELETILPIKELKQFIKNECIRLNVTLPSNYDEIIIDYNKAYLTNSDQEKFVKFKQFLLENNWELISDKYVGSFATYEAKCLICQNVSTKQYSAFMNSACNNCAINRRRNTIDDAHKLAQSKNGICLSTEYINNHTKMSWQCNQNHQWEATYNQMQKDWCSECNKLREKPNKLGIEVYQQAAIRKGGSCLSEIVNSCFEKLQWQCSEGHIWWAPANAIKNHPTRWCPECWKIKKKNGNK